MEASDNPNRIEHRIEKWLDLIQRALPFLWFMLAVATIIIMLPFAQKLIDQGGISKLGFASIQIEFAQQLQRVKNVPVEMFQSPASAKDNLFGGQEVVAEDERKHLLSRLRLLGDKVAGVSILWVDDNHPQQNASLRKALTAIGINVDLARSTEEAEKWLYQSAYDIIITDADRPNDPTNYAVPKAQCYSSPKPSHAGCYLLKTLGIQRMEAGRKYPKMIVYAGNVDPKMGTPPFAMGMTNRPAALIGFVFDAIADLPQEAISPAAKPSAAALR